MAPISSIVFTLVGLVVLGGVIHLAYLLRAYHRGDLSWQRDVDGNSVPDSEPIERLLSSPKDTTIVDEDVEFGDDGVVTIRCPRCEAANDISFDYCRQCVAELGNA